MEENTLKISAVGDIMLGRNIANRINKMDTFYPFGKIRDELLLDSDIIFGNLESPLSHRGQNPANIPEPHGSCPPELQAPAAIAPQTLFSSSSVTSPL